MPFRHNDPMNERDFLQVALFLAGLIALTPLLGRWMAAIFAGEKTFLTPVLGGLESVIYRLSGIEVRREMHWKRYLGALLAFNALGIVVVFGVLVVTFIISRLIPGDPALLMAGEHATRETVQHMRHVLGLDRPLPEQFGQFGQSLGRLRDLQQFHPVIRQMRPCQPGVVAVMAFPGQDEHIVSSTGHLPGPASDQLSDPGDDCLLGLTGGPSGFLPLSHLRNTDYGYRHGFSVNPPAGGSNRVSALWRARRKEDAASKR